MPARPVPLRTAVVHEAGTGNRSNMAIAVTATALVLAGLPATFEAAATLAGAIAGPVLGVFPGFGSPHHSRTATNKASPRWPPPSAPTATPTPNSEGAAMTYDQIIAYTLDQLDRLAGSRPTAQAPDAWRRPAITPIPPTTWVIWPHVGCVAPARFRSSNQPRRGRHCP